MDLGLGPDVNTPGWLIDYQHPTLAGQPFGQGDLLLIPATQARNGDLNGRCFDPQPAEQPLDLVPLAAAIQPAPVGPTLEDCQRPVLTAVQPQHQTLSLAILWQQTNPGLHGRCHVASGDHSSIH